MKNSNIIWSKRRRAVHLTDHEVEEIKREASWKLWFNLLWKPKKIAIAIDRSVDWVKRALDERKK